MSHEALHESERLNFTVLGRLEDWGLEVGGWRLEVGGWRLEVGEYSQRAAAIVVIMM
jgi:hypothetical protein